MADVPVCPVYGEDAILGSLLIVEACSEAVGELVSEAAEPKDKTRNWKREINCISEQLVVC